MILLFFFTVFSNPNYYLTIAMHWIRSSTSLCTVTLPSPSASSASSSTSSTSSSSHTGSSRAGLFLCKNSFWTGSDVVLTQGHAAEPNQHHPDRNRSGRPADDGRIYSLCRSHVPAQVPGIKVGPWIYLPAAERLRVDLLQNLIFVSISTARTTEEEYSRAWGLFMLFHGNFSIHIHTVSIWYTLQVPANINNINTYQYTNTLHVRTNM